VDVGEIATIGFLRRAKVGGADSDQPEVAPIRLIAQHRPGRFEEPLGQLGRGKAGAGPGGQAEIAVLELQDDAASGKRGLLEP
jgi:hypothetical protein